MREFEHQLVLFYLISEPPPSGNQHQHGWPAFILWPVAKRDIDQIQIYFRCMVLPLGYRQGMYPDLMGLQLEMIWVENTLASYLPVVLTVIQYPKEPGQWPCSISPSDSRLHLDPQSSFQTFPLSAPLQHISWDPLLLVHVRKRGEGHGYSCRKCERQKIALNQGSKPVTLKSGDIFLLVCQFL